MKKYLKLSILCLMISCLMIQIKWLPMVLAEESSKTITVLFTHDLHDNFLSSKSEQNGEVVELGGYARLQTAINTQKKQDPEALLLDGGDFSMGTPFQTIYKSEAPELRIMGQMGYDVVTLGNHEFDYRADGLAQSLKVAKNSGDILPQIVQSNVTYPTNKEGKLTESLTSLKTEMENYGVKEYTVIERNGVKIGVFGVMGSESASMAPMSEVEFADEIKYAKAEVKLLKEKEKVDVIICLSHSGTNKDASKSEDEILAKAVPEINLIISGHTHSKLSEPIVVGDTIIGSCEEYGRNLGVVKFSQDSDKGWSLADYHLVPVDDSFAEDEAISTRIAEFKQLVQEEYFDQFGLNYDEVVANSSFDFQTIGSLMKEHKESTLGNLISDAYIYAVKAAEGDKYEPIAVAITPAGTIRGTFLEGNITAADAFSVSSLGMGADNMPGYPLISIYLTGKELKTVCEVDASITPIMVEAQLHASGMSFTFNPNRLIFNKVVKTSLTKEDGSIEDIDDNKLYRVVAGLYSAQMLSVVGEKSYGLLSIVPKTKDGTVVTDFEKQIIYDTTSAKHSELKEWYALVEYLRSFDQENGISQIPQYYSETQGRKVVYDNKNILAILSHPNKIAAILYLILTVLVVILIFIVRLIVRRIKKRNKQKISKKGND